MKKPFELDFAVSTVLALLMVFGSFFVLAQAQSPATATRSISPSKVGVGETFTVTVTIEVNEDVKGLALDELVPDGWSVTPTESSGGNYKASAVQWIWLEVSAGATKTIIYDVTVPGDAQNGDYSITGEVLGAVPEFSSSVTGDSKVSVGAKGDDTVGLYDPTSAKFYLKNDFTGGAADIVVNYGMPDWTPLVGDWDGKMSSSSQAENKESVVNSSLTLVSAQGFPNPASGDKVTFNLTGVGIEETKAEVFTSSGKKVFESGFNSGSSVTWNLKSNSRAKVTNGVYLYVLTAKGAGGDTAASQAKKLIVLR